MMRLEIVFSSGGVSEMSLLLWAYLTLFMREIYKYLCHVYKRIHVYVKKNNL